MGADFVQHICSRFERFFRLSRPASHRTLLSNVSTLGFSESHENPFTDFHGMWWRIVRQRNFLLEFKLCGAARTASECL